MLFEIWELIFFIFLPPPDVAQLILMYLGKEQFIAKIQIEIIKS